MTIRTALITAAGFGTRFLPITKTIQKEMLPIMGRPLVDYIVDDLIAAGVEHIIFVISEHNSQVLHFYRHNDRLRNYLQTHQKLELYDQVKLLSSKAEFTFIRQPDEGMYGTAVPVTLAQPELEDQPAFFVFMGDDFLFSAQAHSESAKMQAVFEASGAHGLVTCIEKPEDELHRYGVISAVTRGDHQFLETIVEKPKPGSAPSNLVNVSKYIFTPEIFPLLHSQQVNVDSGELYITDTLLAAAAAHPFVLYTPEGEYLDGGNPEEWLKANMAVAASNPQLKARMQHWLSNPPTTLQK